MTEKKSTKTRQRILEAAAKSFAGHGYYGVRLEDIAEAAGTKPGSLYYYFDSRDELVEEVLSIATTRIATSVKHAVAALPKSATCREKITVGLRTHLALILGADYFSAASLRIETHMPPLLRRKQIVLQREYGDFWRRLLQESMAKGEIDQRFNLSVLRMLIFGALNWSIEWYKPGGPMDSGEIAEELVDAIFDGVVPRSDRMNHVVDKQLGRTKSSSRRPRATAQRVNAGRDS